MAEQQPTMKHSKKATHKKKVPSNSASEDDSKRRIDEVHLILQGASDDQEKDLVSSLDPKAHTAKKILPKSEAVPSQALSGPSALKTSPRVVTVPPSTSGILASRTSTSSLLSTSSSSSSGKPPKITKYSHKLAERRRRREMRSVFDQLNDLLPSTKGRRSNWEVLSDAHGYVEEMLEAQKIYKAERERLRAEIEALGKEHK